MRVEEPGWRELVTMAVDFLKWSLAPILLIVFTCLNWENLLPVIGFLTHSLSLIFFQHNIYTAEEFGSLIPIIEEFCGSAIVTFIAYRLLKKMLKVMPVFTEQGRKQKIIQDQHNHLDFARIRRDALLVKQIDLLNIERERDRNLIVQLREAIVETKLEIQALRVSKPNKPKHINEPTNGLDLFSPPKTKPIQRRKRFAPNLLHNRKPPEF